MVKTVRTIIMLCSKAGLNTTSLQNNKKKYLLVFWRKGEKGKDIIEISFKKDDCISIYWREKDAAFLKVLISVKSRV